jgi:hypothetical protein
MVSSLFLSDLRNSLSRRYTLEEYLQMVRTKEANKLAKDKIKDFGIDEYIAGKILSNPRAKRLFGFVAGSLLFMRDSIVKAAADPNSAQALAKINKAGLTILSVLRTIGYWILLIMCVIEVLKCVASGDTKEIGKIIMKYLLAFTVLFLMPWLFDLIVGVFS